MRKILFFHHVGAMSGASLSLAYLIEGIRKEGYDAAVCCSQNGPIVACLRERGVKVLICPRLITLDHVNGSWHPLTSATHLSMFLLALLQTPIAVAETCRVLREERPDLVHINSAVLVPCAIGTRLCRVPFVWHIREAAQQGHFGVRLAWLRQAVNGLPNRVICICQDNCDRVKARPEKARVIYNAVDFRRFNRDIDGSPVRAELGIPEGKRVILYCGGGSLIKGGAVVPVALRRLRERMTAAVCIVSGYLIPPGFPGRSCVPLLFKQEQRQLLACVAEFTELQRQGMVINTGFRMDIERLLAACDCLIFPSTVPHFARPVMEAEAMGKPVIASDLGGVSEIVESGVQGLLVPPGDPDALADACFSLLSDAERMRQMGENGYRFARERFDAETNIRQTIKVYEEILGAP